MRHRKGHLALLGAAAIALVAAASGGDSASGAHGASASASAYVREDSGSRSGYVAVSGNATRSDGGARATSRVRDGRGSAEAAAVVSDVDIFNGLVTASRVQVSASASRGDTNTSGSVTGLAIDGRRVDSPGNGSTYDLDGHGTLTVLAAKGDGIVGLDARLSEDYAGRPAGTRVIVGFARARSHDERTRRARPRERDARPPPRARPRRDRGERRERRERLSAEKREALRRAAPALDVLPTGGGYAFPVHGGRRSYSDDWGAPRQHTGTHEGNDVFAPAGTPVLAVTDGTLFRVGTRPIPGNRLWLRNARGDEFFYAHLSAFAQDARNGARVRAGEVVGFVGSTGDAEQTPPHLHFEIHPLGGEAVNPYPFLRAWEERRDVPAAAWLTRYGDDPGSRPGALVVVRDFLER